MAVEHNTETMTVSRSVGCGVEAIYDSCIKPSCEVAWLRDTTHPHRPLLNVVQMVGQSGKVRAPLSVIDVSSVQTCSRE